MAMELALKDAQLDPTRVDYINARTAQAPRWAMRPKRPAIKRVFWGPSVQAQR